tara:strand:- start:510 stop:683 length:174 start_codon:yes stop_codon:yes gene_type:complete
MSCNQCDEERNFDKEDYRLILDALWKRQRCYIAGDKMFKHYGSIISEVERRSEMVKQ